MSAAIQPTEYPLPGNWDRCQLRRVAKIENGADYKGIEVPEGGYPVYGSGGPFARASECLSHGPSVLFGRKGTIDKPLLVTEPFWTADTMFYTRLATSVVPRFLHYYATSIPYRFYSTNTALPSMTQNDLAGHEIPLPPKRTQQEIADFLDRETARIDTLIEKQEKLIETLRERWAATIVDGVTGGTASPRSKSGNATSLLTTHVPNGWHLDRLKHSIESIRAGAWGSEPDGSDDALVVRVADFDRPKLQVRTGFESLRSIAPSDVRKRELRDGDLLLEKSGGGEKSPVGFTVMYRGAREKPVIPSNFVSRIRVRPGLWPRYWLYVHQALYVGRVTARSVLQTTGIQNLDQRSYLDEVVPYPPLNRQREIAIRLDDECGQINTLIAKAERFVELAKERRSALITAAVTGQIEVGEMAVA